MKEIHPKAFSTWNTSISFIFGKTPKVTIICGECYFQFSRRFQTQDFNGRKNPRALCPKCNSINVIPISVKSY